MTDSTAAELTQRWEAINPMYLADEDRLITELRATLGNYDAAGISRSANDLVAAVRKQKKQQSLVAAFLHEYQLNSEEGVVLLSIAEALLRIPDSQTQDLFLQEKLADADWSHHLHHSDSIMVKLSSSALAWTGKMEEFLQHDKQFIFQKLLKRLGAPVIRSALKQSMQYLAYQFVVAENIEAALQYSQKHKDFRYSFDMLGEAAMTANDAERYFDAYLHAIQHLATQTTGEADTFSQPGVSIKLSALCPRYEPLHHCQAVQDLNTKLLFLVQQAQQANINITVDAEESERLAMSLEIFATVFSQPELANWSGFGLAVQAYQKRALPILRWLAVLAKQYHKKIPVRLVKGAYWDSEIKKAQENGISHYPVFTRKAATDLSYLACAAYLLQQTGRFFPQFATHNAHTAAAVYNMGKNHPGFEFQRLHGMGEALYTEILQHQNWPIPCRIYAPVGRYQQLLPYLVRRLLENGANTSFINQVENPAIRIAELSRDPVTVISNTVAAAPAICLPSKLYGEQRLNSQGLNLSDLQQLTVLQAELHKQLQRDWQAVPLVDGKPCSEGRIADIINPADRQHCAGKVIFSTAPAIATAIQSAGHTYNEWRQVNVAERADCLLKAAELLELKRMELVALIIRESGRTLKDALAEIREAVDFCRYYAMTTKQQFSAPVSLTGPTGEQNLLQHFGRGVFACISPWNFPVAIFIGQISAALAAGNTVIAKPASQTPLTAFRCVQLLHQAGIPVSALQLLPATAADFSKFALSDIQIAGVAITGATATARQINQQLAKQHAQIIPLIAETGGQNVLIADSSAHCEQLVQDVLQSAFNSAGQRCSALRVLYIQQDVAERTIKMLIGAMQQLQLGDPGDYSTDVGPVINAAALQALTDHIHTMRRQAKVLHQLQLDKALQAGCFFPPTLCEINALRQLQQEVFGPVLHIIRFRSSELDSVINAVNASGYGLTLGIHSRVAATIEKIRANVRVGNIYINRNMIGAVVGVQPFGGMGLSGTGPKAGGPEYLARFMVEQSISTNTAAVGGNTELMGQDLK